MPKTSKTKDEHEKTHKSSKHSTKSHSKTKSHSEHHSSHNDKKTTHDESVHEDMSNEVSTEKKGMTLNPDMMDDVQEVPVAPVSNVENSTPASTVTNSDDIANEITIGSQVVNQTPTVPVAAAPVVNATPPSEQVVEHTPVSENTPASPVNHTFGQVAQPTSKVSPFLTPTPENTTQDKTNEKDVAAAIATGAVASTAVNEMANQSTEVNPTLSEPANAPSQPTQDASMNLGIGIKKSDNMGNESSEPSSGSSKYKKIIIFILLLLLAVVIGGYLYLEYFSKGNIISPMPQEESGEQSDTSNQQQGSQDYEDPINGLYFSNADAEGFKNRKPIAVMVNNYVEARPSSGVSQADIVYEAVAEGGITRLMPIFYSKIPESVSSIRSARYYFVELASAYKPHYIHWGAAHVPPCQNLPATDPGYCAPVGGKVETEPDVDAYTRIQQLGIANLDGGNYPQCDTCAFGRDPNKVGKIPLEHTAFVRLPEVYNLAKEVRPEESWQQYQEIGKWNFKDEASEADRGDVGITTPITYAYWTTMPDFDVKWEYDKANNVYKRYQGGVKQIDAANNQDLEAKVVIIRFTNERPVGDKKNHLYHDIVGSGDALIFQDGKVEKAKWSRFSHEDRDVYVDASGSPIEFNRGQIWVQLVPTGNVVNYQAATTTPAPATEQTTPTQ